MSSSSLYNYNGSSSEASGLGVSFLSDLRNGDLTAEDEIFRLWILSTFFVMIAYLLWWKHDNSMMKPDCKFLNLREKFQHIIKAPMVFAVCANVQIVSPAATPVTGLIMALYLRPMLPAFVGTVSLLVSQNDMLRKQMKSKTAAVDESEVVKTSCLGLCCGKCMKWFGLKGISQATNTPLYISYFASYVGLVYPEDQNSIIEYATYAQSLSILLAFFSLWILHKAIKKLQVTKTSQVKTKNKFDSATLSLFSISLCPLLVPAFYYGAGIQPIIGYSIAHSIVIYTAVLNSVINSAAVYLMYGAFSSAALKRWTIIRNELKDYELKRVASAGDLVVENIDDDNVLLPTSTKLHARGNKVVPDDEVSFKGTSKLEAVVIN